jgi:hypothetical protein
LFERVKRGEIDLALITFAATSSPTSRCGASPWWVTSMRHLIHMLDVLPLAVSHAGCDWRKAVLDALGSGRKYRIAYSSPIPCGQRRCAGGWRLARCRNLRAPRLRVLTEKDGFPKLRSFDIGLVRKPGRPSSAIEALARHVSESLGNLQTPMMAAE